MKKILILLLLLVLAIPARAAIPEDDGVLRVWLKSLNDPQTLNIILNAPYALEHNGAYRLSAGAQIALTNDSGDIWLESGGLSLNLGPAVTLTRQEAGGGLFIDASNLYRGDLSVIATATGLRPILTLPVEEYLPGVVAFEMSDSFPLEALKAQAVAARIYALQRKQSAGGRAYDLVDTTADQVFRGEDPEFENVAEAVRATEGRVCLYKDDYAACYFTASNGGQTALPSQLWGHGTDDGCLVMKDDPYDLENPLSLESFITITPRCEGNARLKKLLNNALKSPMKRQGFTDFMLDEIVNIEPTAPRFEGSRLFDRLTFDIRVKVPESALATAAPTDTPSPDLPPEPERWVSLDEIQRVSLDVFTDIKEELSMGLNGSDCELISVAREGENFRIAMRRFGHGVGMSQRGAQQMAEAHGMSYTQILNFYYPGATVEKLSWPAEDIAPVEDLPAEARPMPTPAPTPKPLPTPGPGEHTATVDVSSLNVREMPTVGARVVDVLDQGRKVLVASDPDHDGWVKIRTGDYEGYVKAEYLK